MTKMTARARIKKTCKIVKMDGAAGYTISHGEKTVRTDKRLNWLTEEECGAIAESLGLKAERAAKAGARVGKPCECGCGEIAGPRARFRPGHDMKLKSAQLKASRGKGKGKGKGKDLPDYMKLGAHKVDPAEQKRVADAFAAQKAKATT